MATRTSGRAKSSAAKLEKPDLLELYRIMLLARRIDDKEIQLKRQNKIFFQISGAGPRGRARRRLQGLPPRLRLVLHLLSRPGALPRPGHDRHRAAPLGRGRGRRSQLRRPPDAVPLGPQGRSTSSAPPAQPAPSSSRRSAAPRRGCATPGSTGFRTRRSSSTGDEVVLCTTGDGTTSEGEFWEALNTATNLKLPVVFLVEDNGYAISVPVEVNTPGGSISKLLTGFPGLFIQEVDGCDALASFDVLSARRWTTPAPGRVRRWCTRTSSGPTATPSRTTRCTTARRPSARLDAERDPLVRFPKHLLEQGIATQAELDPIVHGGGGRGPGGGRGGARIAAAGHRHDLQLRLLPRRRSHLRAVRHRGRSPLYRRSHHHGGSAEHLPAGRDDPGSPDRALRRGRGRLQPGEESRRRERQGRGLQGDLGAAARLRRRPGLQLAAGRGQHHRPGHRAGHPGAQAGGRDPVLRLHLAGVHAAPERARADALALEQRLRGTGRGPGDLRRLPEGWLGVSLPDRGRGLYRRARPAGRVSLDLAGCQRAAPDRHPLRGSGALPGAQAPLPPDLQQGAESRAPTS